MNTCSVEGCNQVGAFSTRTRPTWCLDHLRQLYVQGGLTLLDDFTKPSHYLLTQCNQCHFEGHYRFEYVLDRARVQEPVCRACFWRGWAESARAMSGMSRQPVDVSLVRRNAEEHGYTYLGPLSEPSLEGDPHATRCDVCGRIEAQRNADIGWGCPCQRNPKSSSAGAKKSRGANLLKNSDSKAVGWWDHERNDQSFWDTATIKARREAWWICPEGHSFLARILDITNKHSECPFCREERVAAWQAKRASYAGKTIADVPALLAAWEENIPPESVLVDSFTGNSGYRFRCMAGHRNTRQPLSWLFGGCSACKAAETRKGNALAATKDPNFTRLSPEISGQWHPTKNGKLLLSGVSPESRRQVWWLDPVCGHEFQATPRERDKYDRWRCPVCHSILDSLAYHYPDVAEEWSPENQLSPWMIRPNTTQLQVAPLWVCKNEVSHVWRAMPGARVNGAQCPECLESGKSQIELEYYSSALAYWGNAKSGSRIHSAKFQNHSSWTVDVLVDLPDGERLAIEYDGSYWHGSRTETDRVKSIDLLAAGIILVRIREAPLTSLEITDSKYYELTVYPAAQEPTRDIQRIAEIIKS